MPWHSCWGPWGIPWFFPFLFVAFGGFVLWMVFGRNRKGFLCSPGATGSETETSLDIAKRRYAKGEISKEEFEEIKRHLL